VTDHPTPLHQLHLEDARRHLNQAIASLRAAAAANPATARAAGGLHSVLIDAAEQLGEMLS
jgi:hypothetical protein